MEQKTEYQEFPKGICNFCCEGSSICREGHTTAEHGRATTGKGYTTAGERQVHRGIRSEACQRELAKNN